MERISENEEKKEKRKSEREDRNESVVTDGGQETRQHFYVSWVCPRKR